MAGASKIIYTLLWQFLVQTNSRRTYITIVRTPLFKGGSEFQIPHLEGGKSEKFKKGGGSMVQGQVFLKDGGVGSAGLALFLFNFFKVHHFYN